MSIENVKKFYEAISQDKEIQQKFIDLNQKYQGQPMDEANGLKFTEQEFLPLAKQLGYEFSMDDLKTYNEEMKHKDMNRELSDEEMQAVAGGGTDICVLLGCAADGVTGFCLVYGLLVNKDIGSACIFIGATQG